MEISFLSPHLELYGGIRRVIELSNRLVERGHNVTIFHSNGSPCKWMECKATTKSLKEVLNEEHDVLISIDASLYPIFKRAKAKLKAFYLLALYDKWALSGPIWLQVRLFLADMYLRLRKRLSKVPRVYSIYSEAKREKCVKKADANILRTLIKVDTCIFRTLMKNLNWDPNYMRVLKKCLHYNCLILSNATWMYQWLKDELKINSKLLIGGINTDMFRPVDLTKNPKEIRILCSGDPRERKGTRTVLEAIEIAKQEEPRIVLDTYYGKGIPQEKMAEKYCSADIFVDGQWYAGWNNPVAEAMACKVPVVCTDIGGVKDFAFHEKTALLVPPKDPKAMAAAILRLIRDKELRETLRENAYKHIRQFDWDKSAKRLEEILASELRRKGKRVSKIWIAIDNPRKALDNGKAIPRKVFRRSKGFDKYGRFGVYHWESYDNDPIYRKHVNYIIEGFKKKSRGSLLDVGCGDGLISHFLAEIGFKVKGIDVEPEAIKLAQRKSSLSSFEVLDIFEVDERFDYLLASEVIEHLPNPDDFLKKVKELFTREALVTTPKRDYYKDPDPYHVREYSFFEFESLLRRHFRSFRVEASEYNLYAWIEK